MLTHKIKTAFAVCLSLSLGLIYCTNEKPADRTLFSQVGSSHSGVTFSNTLKEDDHFNIIEYLYFYNGGGVAVGDINNDSLPDIYFSSNQGSNKLYLNKGDFKFEDITESAGVRGGGNWKTGVTMADVNDDGYLDIYLCGVGNYKSFDGFNQLFINNGDLTFTEQSEELGLGFRGFSTQSAFFDYDRDGDLDMYLLNHSVHSTRSYGKKSLRYQSDSLAGDRLYKNLLNETGSIYFKEVTEEAGIYSSSIGYGLGIGISDLNKDGWPDIYVSNDFHENDYLYINQKNGSFSQQAERAFAHTSRFSMGNDIADVNNDSWSDVVTLDMLPRDESVIKTSAGEDSYEVYKYKLSAGYGRQVSRNTLQVNRGPIDSGRLVFSDVAQAAGVEATDWSWCPLIVDFDGDGNKDLFVSNGIVRRPNNLDYINFISNDSIQKSASWLQLAQQMPEGKVTNVVYQGDGKLGFADKTTAWGIDMPSFSNGAAYGDLDADGDPDLVVNQINGEALLYRNNAQPGRFVKLKLRSDGLKGNKLALGTRVELTSGGVNQMQELNVSRGWCSSSDYSLMFGVRPGDSVTLRVTWPDGRVSRHKAGSGQKVMIDYSPAYPTDVQAATNARLLAPTDAPDFVHAEDDFNAFNREQLIPHMLSTEGPPMAVADIDGDERDDLFVGGARGQSGMLFKQNNGRFLQWKSVALEEDDEFEDTDAAFFDADSDGDQDLVVVSGGQEQAENRALLVPRLYLNNGKGTFRKSENAFTNIFLHASCVKPHDYDGDGDVDLFLGAVVMPFLYGMAPMSFLLSNDGSGKFSFDPSWLGSSTFDNVTRIRPGMIKDASWIDVNKDGLTDLILVGEWMPITVLIQQGDHRFLNRTADYGLANTNGWWNTCETGDFDRDGDLDLVVGNLGLNSRIKATVEKPLVMYLGDFDSNQGSDHIIVYYNGDSSYPFPSRDQLVRQIPSLKKKFLYYRDYRDVKLEDIITPVQKGNSAMLKVELFASVLLVNNNSDFQVRPLPLEAQYFPIYGVKCEDVDSDGNLDLLVTGNLGATQPDFGSYDAGVGVFLKGDGSGKFDALRAERSGFVTLGEGRDVEVLKTPAGPVYIVSRNNQSILAFKKR